MATTNKLKKKSSTACCCIVYGYLLFAKFWSSSWYK